MDAKEAEALNTSLTASEVLSTGARRLSASLDSFSGWLLAGFGATYGLLLANIDSLTPYLSISSVKSGAVCFLVAACLGAAQKFIAAYVAAGTAAADDGHSNGNELAKKDIPLNVESMYRQVNQGLLWPWRNFNTSITDKARAGDYAVIGRFHAKASQIQCYLVALQAIVSLISAALLIDGIAI